MCAKTRIKIKDDPDQQKVIGLISSFLNGDESAFREIVTMYTNQVGALAYKFTNDYDEAADIAQNVFLKLYRSLHLFDSKKRFYTWLYRITANASIDYLRKHKRHKHEPIENSHHIADKKVLEPDFRQQCRQLKKHVNSAIDKLDKKQKQIFTLRQINNHSVAEISKLLNMPPATVRWYLHRANAKMRKLIKRECPSSLLSTFINTAQLN